MSGAQVIQLFRDAAFDPEMVERLCTAYELAASRLHDRGRPAIVNELIAKRIIDLAAKGDSDPYRLAEAALIALGFDRI